MAYFHEQQAFFFPEFRFKGLLKWVEGGILAAQDFLAAAAEVGIRKPRLDCGLLVSKSPCVVAGTFTRNSVKAAPLLVTMERVRTGRARALVANSGVANACTGPSGLEAARRVARRAAELLACPEEEVLVASTGVIGEPLPADRITRALPGLVENLNRTCGSDFARAIMTTDTRPKQAAVELQLGGGSVRIGGVAKGAGMIHPNMATMLAFIASDARIKQPRLDEALRAAVEVSFNSISVDGDTSTNDMVLAFANGASGVEVSTDSDLETFGEGLKAVCLSLARQIVADGEGASKWITVRVSGAPSAATARSMASRIANSLLVKTAVAGGDANWGRILAAAGATGEPLELERVTLRLDGEVVFASGKPQPLPVEREVRVFAGPGVEIELDLGSGRGEWTVYTCDITEEYVRINAEYRT